jgi:hypothetical protein
LGRLVYPGRQCQNGAHTAFRARTSCHNGTKKQCTAGFASKYRLRIAHICPSRAARFENYPVKQPEFTKKARKHEKYSFF